MKVVSICFSEVVLIGAFVCLIALFTMPKTQAQSCEMLETAAFIGLDNIGKDAFK